jgi:hypothetical protein
MLIPSNISRAMQSSGFRPQGLSLMLIAIILMACLPFRVAGQTPTVVLNDQAVIQPQVKRVGLNIGASDYWDSGQILKNLIGSINPGFEPLMAQQIGALLVPGTTTSFTDPDLWDGQPPNYWVGGTFTVVTSQSGGKELGCSGTIASNTGPNYPPGSVTTYTYPTYTTSAPCLAPFAVGDVIVLSKTTSPTPEAWWENSEGGPWTAISGGGKLVSNTTDLCATCGSQSLTLDASTSGSSAGVTSYFDATPAFDLFVLMNGTYEISFWAKAASGSPVLAVSALRASAGGFNCGTHNQSLTSSWALYTIPCTASESTKTTTPGLAHVSVIATGGAAYFDNFSFQKTGTDPANTSVLRDEVFNAFKNFYQTQSGGNPGMLRDWLNQNAETFANWTSPDYAQKPTASGHGYFAGPVSNGAVTISLEDYLNLCKALNAEPYLEVPVTITTQDAASLIEFLAGPSTSTAGSRRAALGQANPWTSVFEQIHLSFCNECWNGSSFSGQSLPSRNGAPNSEYYYDYSTRAKDIFAAMRGNSYYTQSAFDFVMNAQTAVNYSMDAAIARAHPDSIEIEGYTYGTVNSFATDTALWQPLGVENNGRFINPTDPTNFYQSVHDYQSQSTCGANASSVCHVNVYEFGSGTTAGSIDQKHLDYISAGAGDGVYFPLLALQSQQYDNINAESYFSLAEYQNNAVNGLIAKDWGIAVDMGGATNNVRPQYLGLSLANQSMIGPMYDCSITNNATFNFAAVATNGTQVPSGVPAMADVPYLYSFCFENGNNRSVVLINTDISVSHTISFSGTNIPTGTVVERQYAPASLDLLNEAPSGTASNTAVATVALTSTTLNGASSITLPPHSVTALDFTATNTTTAPPAGTPAFSVSGGTYTSAQTVSISDTTSGAIVYYTTNGTTPTTGSTRYTGAIAVSASESLNAIAVATGYSQSPVASAAYVIAGQTAMPTALPAAGSYASTQSVSLSSATPGAVIYFTTDGTTPTPSSTTYSAPISVASSVTLKAIAAAPSAITSPVSSQAYTITGTTPTINFATGFNPTGMNLYGATFVGNVLELTDGKPNESHVAWFTTPVNITSFTTDFAFQATSAIADGFTFTIQNAPKGILAVGGNGSKLGYGGIASSVAIKFDLHSNAGEGDDSTGLYVNGATPTVPSVDMTASGVNLHSGDVMQAHVGYDGANLTLTVTDTVTKAVFNAKTTINIPQTVGANTALVGFTAGSGGNSSVQTVRTWTFSPGQ